MSLTGRVGVVAGVLGRPRPGRSAARSLRVGDPVAQPSHVAARARVGGIARVDRCAGRVFRHRRPRRPHRRRRPVRVRGRVGVAIAVVATVQVIVALMLDRGYDPTILRTFAVAVVYPIAYWIIAATAALRSQTIALVRCPRKQRVVWDIPREPLETVAA